MSDFTVSHRRRKINENDKLYRRQLQHTKLHTINDSIYTLSNTSADISSVEEAIFFITYFCSNTKKGLAQSARKTLSTYLKTHPTDVTAIQFKYLKSMW